MFQHLFSDGLQLLCGGVQAVGGVLGAVQRSDRGAHCPVASFSSAHALPMIVTATCAAAPAVWTGAVGSGVAVTAAHLQAETGKV